MKKVFTSLALAMLCTAGLNAQTGKTTTGTASDQNTQVGGDQHCLAQADEQTWSTLGLTEDQITRVNEIQRRYKAEKHHDRGTENTMRGTREDSATPATGTATQSGTIGTDRTSGTTDTDRTSGSSGTTGTTGSDRTDTDQVGTPGTDRPSGTTGADRTTGTGTTGTNRTGTDATGTSGTTGTTGTDRTSGTTGTTGTDTDRTPGTTGTTGSDRTSGTTGTDRTGTSGTTGTTGVDRKTGTTGSDTHGTTGSNTDTYGNAGSTRTSDQLGYDDTYKESMERELRTVLTTAQFDRYQEWCQDQDASRGDRNMDMDR